MKLQRLLSLTCLTLAVTFAGFSGTASAQGANVLQVATDATFPPMEFTENGARTGFDIDIMNALAKAMGKTVQWTDIDFKGLIPGLIAKDRKSTRLNSSHSTLSRMPSSA